MDATAYLALAAGYLLATLAARHLTWYGLALLTALNVLYVAAFRRMSSEAGCSERDLLLLSIGIIGVTMAVEALCLIGMGFDWLMPIVTVTLMGIFFPLRWGFAFAGAVWLSTMALLYLLDGHHLTLQDQIELPPAFIFAFVFAVVVRYQFEQRERAEQLVTQLEAAQTELRARASEAEELAVTRERNRVAREIHDTLGHYLTILAVQLETATKLEERGDPRLREELVEARRVASECLAEVRRSVAALRPADPTVTSFASALARLAAAFQASQPETELALDMEGQTQELSPELRMGLFRVVQESLTNIRKHAHASKVLVRLRADAEQVELTVLDNGRGAQSGVDGHEPGFGLLGMRERVELLGGTVRAGPEPEHGWRVEVRIPLPVRDGAASAPRPAEQTLAAS
jgi:signal transduction histidine kinase